MALFHIGKKKDGAGTCCCNAGDNLEGDILVLGSGCKNCQTLEGNVHRALKLLGNDRLSVGHIRDFAQIAQYGVMSTPALVIKGKAVSAGKVLKPEEIVDIIKANY